MEPNGPTWSQKDIKTEPKAAKREPEAPKSISYGEKVRQKAINGKNKRCSEKVGTRTSTGIRSTRPECMFPGFMLNNDNDRFGDPTTVKSDGKTKQKSIIT